MSFVASKLQCGTKTPETSVSVFAFCVALGQDDVTELDAAVNLSSSVAEGLLSAVFRF